MKNLKFIIVLFLTSFLSCNSFLDVNENKGQLTSVPSGELLLKGTLLANAQLHKGHLLRSAMYYSGQLIGKQLVQETIYSYTFTPGDANNNWRHLYNGILIQNKEIRRLSGNVPLLLAIADINEAMAMGTAASIWGDIPYTEAIPDDVSIESKDPKYDSQESIYEACQTLLDRALTTLSTANPNSLVGAEDIYNSGSISKWTEAAYTLKARYYLQTKNYSEAIKYVQMGISEHTNSTKFIPIGSVVGNSNIINILVNSSRSGDLTGEGSFYLDLLDTGKTTSRNNIKTDETARREYTFIIGDDTKYEDGIDGKDTPMDMVTFEENLLIWAECALRNNDFATALAKLNELRAYLNSGDAFNIVSDATPKYDPYIEGDFESGGLKK